MSDVLFQRTMILHVAMSYTKAFVCLDFKLNLQLVYLLIQ